MRLTVGPGAPVGQPATHRPVQRVAVDAAQQSPHRRLRRQAPLRGQRIRPYTEALQDGRRASVIHSPTAGREVAPVRTAHAVSASTTIRACSTTRGSRARVGNLGQSLQQARDLLGHGFGMLAEWVKGRQDRR
ncbi:hypothetical protein GCM10010254_68280 [Streptomyces chromofuscus]|nr:hypothetical protein GCM10010254_68280 [Streptomyces chromofuscus]